MRNLFLLSIAWTAFGSTNAQTTERTTVRSGESIATAFPGGFFRFPQFTEGIFIMKNGAQTRALCNYSITTDEILYIKNTGDTMSVGVPEEIEKVLIGDNATFIYNNKSYLEILTGANDTRLAKKIKVTVEKDKKGGYGESAASSSQDHINNLNWATQLWSLSHDVVVIKTTTYYWLNKQDKPQPATKKNLLKLVPKEKQAKLEEYISTNNINFNNEEDLTKLLVYLYS